MGTRLLKMAMVALLAMVLGYGAALGIGVVAFEVFDVSQREGANAMALAFFICPLVAVVSAVVAGAWYWVRTGRRAATAGPPTPGRSRGIGGRVLLIVAAAAGGWLAGLILQWVLAGRSYETFVVALVVSLAPWIGAILCGGGTWWRTRTK
jgi:hypothetical protein